MSYHRFFKHPNRIKQVISQVITHDPFGKSIGDERKEQIFLFGFDIRGSDPYTAETGLSIGPSRGYVKPCSRL
jgi:hypothetical protein